MHGSGADYSLAAVGVNTKTHEISLSDFTDCLERAKHGLTEVMRIQNHDQKTL